MGNLRLYKRDKLCSVTAINRLFSRDASNFTVSAFPVRAIWRVNDHRADHGVQFVISVPKKKLRHAVDRVKMRRRIREAYRLLRHQYTMPDLSIDVMFMYVDSQLHHFPRIERSMRRLLEAISTHNYEQAAEETV